jgi:hypothetical protein
MRNVSGKNCRVNQNTHVVFNLYGKMWKNCVEPARPQMTIWRMRIGCWLPKAIDAYREYSVIAFPLQKTLRENASLLRYIISCLVGITELIPQLVAGTF